MEFNITENVKDFYSHINKCAKFGETINVELSKFSEKERYVVQSELYIIRGGLAYNSAIKSNNELKEEFINYIQNRLCGTTNTFLIATYNRTLWELCKDNRYAEDAIQHYRNLIKEYTVGIINQHVAFIIGKIWDTVLQISGNIKSKKLPEIGQELIGLVINANESFELRYWLLFHMKKNYDSCKLMQLSFSFVPQVCLDLLSQCDKYSWRKNLLEIGAFFADRYDKGLLPVLYEKLGDNEEKNIRNPDDEPNNIAIPLINHVIYEKMLRYYDNAKNRDKYDEILQKYNDNKSKIKLIPIVEKMEIPQSHIELVNKTVNDFKKATTEEALCLLSIHNNLFFLPSDIITELWKSIENKKYLHINCLDAETIDINGNLKQEKHEDYYKYFIFINHYRNSYRIIYEILSSLIQQKTITYAKIRKTLTERTTFGDMISIKKGDAEIKYCWFDKIDSAMKDFLSQFDRMLKGRATDWKVSITLMTTQFESILRDYNCIYGDGNTKLHGRSKQEIREILFDELVDKIENLSSELGSKVFSMDDIHLFKYTFTNKGLNIRNNIAHGFYIPQDYTCEKAVLVFLCLMRLVRFKNRN
ncbi:MAG: hypothetical protein CW341_07135 [Bacteroidetes bacterium]|nr:hypothetical protein [Bacteroidota bacterium]